VEIIYSLQSGNGRTAGMIISTKLGVTRLTSWLAESMDSSLSKPGISAISRFWVGFLYAGFWAAVHLLAVFPRDIQDNVQGSDAYLSRA